MISASQKNLFRKREPVVEIIDECNVYKAMDWTEGGREIINEEKK